MQECLAPDFCKSLLYMIIIRGHGLPSLLTLLQLSPFQDALSHRRPSPECDDPLSPVARAVFRRRADLLRCMLQHKAAFEAFTPENSASGGPMHLAAYHELLPEMEIMLEHDQGRQALQLADGRGQTPVHKAAAGGHHKLLEVMLQHSEGIAALGMSDHRCRKPLDMTDEFAANTPAQRLVFERTSNEQHPAKGSRNISIP